MHLMGLTFCIVIFNAAIASAHPKLEKLRRGSSGLVPFPRVGRGSGQTWDVAIDDYGLTGRENIEKRKLYAFPRVGRGDPVPWSRLSPQLQLQELENLLLNSRGFSKRNSDSGNMWFGPRLGRAAKRDVEYDEDDTPQKASTLDEGRGQDQGFPERVECTSENRKKRQIN